MNKLQIIRKLRPRIVFTNLNYSNVSGAPEITNSKTPNPKEISTDMIGPVHSVSNLRMIVFKHPNKETKLERTYREMRIEVQEWNQRFWTAHNSSFVQEREKYLKKHLPEGRQSLTADEMSVFYKSFLDKNWNNHVNYNIEWYRKNIKLLGLAIRIKFNKLFK